MKTSLEREGAPWGKKLSSREECWGIVWRKGKVSLDSDRSYSEVLLERADPQDPGGSQWLHCMALPAGQKGCASFLIIKANTSESAGRSPVSLTTVGFILSEFLLHNIHETTHILIDR